MMVEDPPAHHDIVGGGAHDGPCGRLVHHGRPVSIVGLPHMELDAPLGRADRERSEARHEPPSTGVQRGVEPSPDGQFLWADEHELE